MQVDGLTNDEVKSHLQVRLTQKKKSKTNFWVRFKSWNSNPEKRFEQKYRLHVRKLGPTEGSGGGGWMAEAHQGDHHSKTSATHAGSPDGPLQGGGSGKALSITEGESMEGEEDAKSEGHSWKGRIQKVGDWRKKKGALSSDKFCRETDTKWGIWNFWFCRHRRIRYIVSCSCFVC